MRSTSERGFAQALECIRLLVEGLPDFNMFIMISGTHPADWTHTEPQLNTCAQKRTGCLLYGRAFGHIDSAARPETDRRITSPSPWTSCAALPPPLTGAPPVSRAQPASASSASPARAGRLGGLAVMAGDPQRRRPRARHSCKHRAPPRPAAWRFAAPLPPPGADRPACATARRPPPCAPFQRAAAAPASAYMRRQHR